jgi:hypothetical protein
VSDAPASATVSVSCAGKRKGCPKDRAFTTSAKGSVSMTKMFRKRLRPGAVVTVTVTAPNTVGRGQEVHDPPGGQAAHADALPRAGRA